jgi:hypothetical protein
MRTARNQIFSAASAEVLSALCGSSCCGSTQYHIIPIR